MGEKTEVKYRALFESNSQAVAVVGADGVIQEANSAIERIMGYTRGELVGRSFWDIPEFKEEDVSEYMEVFRKLTAGEPAEAIELPVVAKDGSRRWIEAYPSPLVVDGQIHGFQVVAVDITMRRLAEQALKESEERFRTLFDNVPVGVFRNTPGPEGRFITANPALARMHGYDSPAELMKCSVASLYANPDERRRLSGIMQRDGKVDDFEVELKRADGTTFRASVRANAIRNEAGEIEYFDGMLIDVTARRKAEEELRYRTDFERLLGWISSWFIQNDPGELGETVWNSLAMIATFSGVDRAYVFQFGPGGGIMDNTYEWCADGIEPQKDRLQNIRLEEEMPWFAEEIKKEEPFHVPDVDALPPEAVLEKKHFREQGIKSLIALQMYDKNRLAGLVGFDSVRSRKQWSEDIILLLRFYVEMLSNALAQSRVENALRESERRFRTMVENMASGVFCHDLDGNLVLVNRSAARMTGYTKEELLGMTVADLDAGSVERDDRGTFWERLEAGESVSFQAMHRRKDGSEYPVELNLNRMELDGRQVILGAALDITDRVRAEEEKERLDKQLLQSQKMDAVGQLAGGVAHDFNNMLGVIIGYTHMVMSEMGEDDTRREDLEQVLDAARRSRELTMKLLTFSRKEKIDVRAGAAHTLLQSVIDMLERTLLKKIEINTDIDKDLFIEIDENQMHQAILNICTNARDSMPGGGALSIEAKRVAADSMPCGTCGGSIDGPHCFIQISDTGVGMSEDILSRAFEPFFTTKGAGKGTGLGLSTSLGIIRNHGGHLNIYSEPGRGTNTKIYLPLMDTGAETSGEHAEYESPAGGSETILVVDDEESLLRIACSMLEKAGYSTVPASGGEEAVEIFRERHGGIDAVLLDIVMPVMDGGEALDAMMKIDPGVKAVLASGYSINGQAGELMRRGACAFVQKPFLPEEALSTIRKVLDQE